MPIAEASAAADRLRMGAPIGQVIKEYRERAKLTQADLAVRIRVDRGQVSRWERGKNAPHGAHARALVRVLGIPADVLGVDEVAEQSSVVEPDRHPSYEAWLASLGRVGLSAPVEVQERMREIAAQRREGPPVTVSDWHIVHTMAMHDLGMISLKVPQREDPATEDLDRELDESGYMRPDRGKQK